MLLCLPRFPCSHNPVSPQRPTRRRRPSCSAASPLGWEGLDEAQLHDAEGGTDGVGHRDEGVAHSLVVVGLWRWGQEGREIESENDA